VPACPGSVDRGQDYLRLSMSVANPIAAAAAAKTPEGQFRAMDVNGDGFISMDEWMAEKKKAKVLYEGSPNCCGASRLPKARRNQSYPTHHPRPNPSPTSLRGDAANCGAWFAKTSYKITDKDIEITSGMCGKKIEHVDVRCIPDALALAMAGARADQTCAWMPADVASG
jgi:hypothetical protein